MSEKRNLPMVLGVRLGVDEFLAAQQMADELGVSLPKLMRSMLRRRLRAWGYRSGDAS
jgi:hypothetical protein